MPLNHQIRIRLKLGEETAFGPGKADLLDAIRSEGSISAAAKAMGMSYRRAWLLVDTMNRCFTSPLVDSAKGGSGGGGAEVTARGAAMLADFRELQQQVEAIVATSMPRFDRQVGPAKTGKAGSARPTAKKSTRRTTAKAG
ncbi:MAG: bacterial regulatory helix-turn-helix, lysR family protein [Nevskia sp.]|nr:bacterial regulatory helix-turn-helix, lysR family protein [Nevskia sp.]